MQSISQLYRRFPTESWETLRTFANASYARHKGGLVVLPPTLAPLAAIRAEQLIYVSRRVVQEATSTMPGGIGPLVHAAVAQCNFQRFWVGAFFQASGCRNDAAAWYITRSRGWLLDEYDTPPPTHIGEVPVHTCVDFTYVRMSEVPHEQRDVLRAWLRGQTRPMVPDISPSDAIYSWDYERFLKGLPIID